MEDAEIKTKRLTNWKPETDIKLQKAFGKFIEEVGELLDVGYEFLVEDNSSKKQAFESEVADCQATFRLIERASGERMSIDWNEFHQLAQERIKVELADRSAVFSHLSQMTSKCLRIVGRCQIQGIDKSDPETYELNLSVLENKISFLEVTLLCIIKDLSLNWERIIKRRDDKVESKLPWVMGTATDLLPDA